MDRRDFTILILVAILAALLVGGAYTLDRRNAEVTCKSVVDGSEYIDVRVDGYRCFVKTEEDYWVRVYGIEHPTPRALEVNDG